MSKNDWTDLETFKDVGIKNKGPYVVLSPRPSITLSSGFLLSAREQIEGKTHVILSFAKSKNAIVFSFTKDAKAPGALKMALKGNATIAARSFVTYFNLEPKMFKGKYKAQLEDIPNIGESWVIYLDQKLKHL